MNVDSRAGLLGGTFLTICMSSDVADLARTASTAAVGACVSFLLSKALQWLFDKYKLKKSA